MQVRLHGSDVQFRCEPGQTLLAAGLAAGLDLPYECASGSCGSCRARLLEGQVRWRWAAAPGLSERDRSKGDRILCCQAEPESDCVMQLRTGPGPLPAAPRPRQATVSRLRPLNEDVLELQLRLTDGLPMDYRPGQFVLLQAPPTIGWRAYSMANLPAADGTLQFLVKRKPGGGASGWLFGALRPGDAVALEGPYGRAWLRDEPADRPLWLLAGAPAWRQSGPSHRLRWRPFRSARCACTSACSGLAMRSGWTRCAAWPRRPPRCRSWWRSPSLRPPTRRIAGMGLWRKCWRPTCRRRACSRSTWPARRG